jgi:hypothetical protein
VTVLDAIKERVTYANVLSTLCLFLLLGGGTAVALRGRNSVNSGDIKNGQVKTRDLRKGAVRSSKLADGAVTPSKIDLQASASIAAPESTSSPNATDLPTPGPRVTIDVPEPGSLAAIYASADIKVGSNGPLAFVSLARSSGLSAGIMSAAFANGFFVEKATSPGTSSGTTRTLGGWLVIQLDPGSQTFTLKYAVTGGTATFKNRVLAVALIR